MHEQGVNHDAKTVDQEISSAQFSNLNSPASGPSCSICLSPSHPGSRCPGKICCWKCRNFGHTRNVCLTRSALKLSWKPKFNVADDGTEPRGRLTRVKPHLVWAPKARVSKATDILDSCAIPPGSPPSHNNE
jgi:hypothetical protein